MIDLCSFKYLRSCKTCQSGPNKFRHSVIFLHGRVTDIPSSLVTLLSMKDQFLSIMRHIDPWSKKSEDIQYSMAIPLGAPGLD